MRTHDVKLSIILRLVHVRKDLREIRSLIVIQNHQKNPLLRKTHATRLHVVLTLSATTVYARAYPNIKEIHTEGVDLSAYSITIAPETKLASEASVKTPVPELAAKTPNVALLITSRPVLAYKDTSETLLSSALLYHRKHLRTRAVHPRAAPTASVEKSTTKLSVRAYQVSLAAHQLVALNVSQAQNVPSMRLA